MFCPLCNSEHADDAFSVGWYFDAEGVVHKVVGHDATFGMMADPDNPVQQMFWSQEAVEAEILQRNPPEVIGGGG